MYIMTLQIYKQQEEKGSNHMYNCSYNRNNSFFFFLEHFKYSILAIIVIYFISMQIYQWFVFKKISWYVSWYTSPVSRYIVIRKCWRYPSLQVSLSISSSLTFFTNIMKVENHRMQWLNARLKSGQPLDLDWFSK